MDPLTHLLEAVRNVPADRLADALRNLHSRRSAHDAAPVNGEHLNGNGSIPAATYDDARRFFVEVERRRKRERAAAEAILERLHAREVSTRERAARAFPAQQTVQVTTLPGTTAGARFVVVNPHQRAIRVRFDVGTPMHAGSPAAAVRITLSAPVLEMLPGGRQIVRARIDLRSAGLRDGDQVEIPVEARTGDRALMKVWIEVNVAAAEARDG
jgi:hypothetical protein